MSDSLRINKDKLLFVEGVDDRAVIYRLLKSLNIDNIQVICIDGKDNRKKFIDTLSAALKSPKETDFQINAFAIMLDADNEAKSSFQKACSILKELQKRKIKNLDFDIPKKFAEFTNSKTKAAVFIMPDCKCCGMLETLCLNSVKDDPFYNCVESFISNAKGIKNDLDYIEKRKVLSFIALKAKKGHKKSLGEAFEDDIFNINSDVFDLIIKFLKDLSLR